MDLDFSPEKFETVLQSILSCWIEAHNTEGIFRYKLEIKEQKILDGNLNFLCQLNPQRTSLRRIPQQIKSLETPFDNSIFNFKKISSKEHLLEVIFKKNSYTFIVNQSPLTKYHSLICPQLNLGLPQKLTKDALIFTFSFMKNISDTNFQIGYNSPGALASVNHLHLHLMHIKHKLYVNDVNLESITGSFHVIDRCNSFNKGFCYVINQDMNVNDAVEDIYNLVSMFYSKNIPHNLFVVRNSDQSIRVFIFVRENFCRVKDSAQLNIAFCELAGYVPVGDEKLYNSLNESFLLNKFDMEIGNAFDKVLNYIKSL